MRELIAAALLVCACSFGLRAAGEEGTEWDFVPGEKLLLYNDFTDMARGAAPPHWKVRGGALKLVDGRLAATQGQESTMWPNVAKWPDNFTIEMEFQSKPFEEPITPGQGLNWSFDTAGNWVWHAILRYDALGGCTLLVEIAAGAESQGVDCKVLLDKPNSFAAWVQDGRLRFYLNGDRLMDLNQVKTKFETAYLAIEGGRLPVSFGSYRIAESAPDFSETLLAAGRYVTHGIQFDVNSSILRGESKPVLQRIADALAGQPGLKLCIEGHTDSSGDPAANLDLSKRRAQAVKDALIGQFGIPESQLTTAGFGDTKPAGSNATPRGRAENRRVEFVKL